MKLNEKISWYRRRAKLSQEELAAQVGVSRQAVSKWELAESVPDINKLLALAKAFGVTTDELLSEDEPAGSVPPPSTEPTSTPEPPHGSNWRFVGRMIQRWGWLAGIYIALQGAGVALAGGIARYALRSMLRRAAGFTSGFGIPGAFDGGWTDTMDGAVVLPDSLTAGPVGMWSTAVNIATLIMVVGLVIVAAGLILAVVLRSKGNKKG